MKRSQLVWFATGAAVSGLSSIAASVFATDAPQLVPMLAAEERFDRLLELESEDERRKTRPLNGKLLHECGAKAFEMDAVVPDGGGQARVPITRENETEIECILKNGAQQGFEMSVTFSPNLRVQGS